MSILRRIQDSPHPLELAYQATESLLRPFEGWLQPGSRFELVLIRLEEIGKGALFDCRMCGQCVLHDTGMTCPMTCPKNLRNGPCGGVRPDGNCEVYPDKPCVWVQAWERSKQMPIFGAKIKEVQAPVNHSLRGTSAWINEFHRKQEMIPRGWKG